MKRKAFKASVSTLYSKNPIIFLLSVIYLIGFVAGAVARNYIGINTQERILNLFKIASNFNENVSKLDFFFYNSLSNFALFFFIVFFGLSILGIPFIFLINAYKGFGTGFTISFIISLYGLKGLFICLLVIIPPTILMFILLIRLSSNSLLYSYSLINSLSKGTRTRVELTPLTDYFQVSFIVYLFSFFAVLYEVYVSGYFIKLFFN